MSQTTGTDTNNQLTVNTDTSKIFILNNRYDKFGADYENSTYDDITWPAGTLMGQISATKKVIPLASGASDGSQYPLGILAQDVTIDAGDTLDKDVTLCVEGDVAQDKVVLDGSDTLDTVISGRTIRARIGGDTVGVKLVVSTEMTAYDNQ